MKGAIKMKAHTKITLKELIARKEQMLEAKKTPKTVDLYIPSLDGTVTIEEPDRDLVIEAQGMDGTVGDIYMVYQCVIEPPLKSTDLQKEFDCKEPMEIVDKIFASGEIPAIARECMGNKNPIKNKNESKRFNIFKYSINIIL